MPIRHFREKKGASIFQIGLIYTHRNPKIITTFIIIDKNCEFSKIIKKIHAANRIAKNKNKKQSN